MTTSVISGLTDAEVAQRVADGKTNDVPTRAARSVSDIVRANVFTYAWVSENSPPATISKATFDGNKLTLEYYETRNKGTFTK